jgi:porin
MKVVIKYPALLPVVILSLTNANAHELTEKLSLDGVLAGAFQCQKLAAEDTANDTCKSTAALQPAFTYRTSPHNRLLFKLGFAVNNSLNEASPFNISAWGADLEDDVVNINGSGRDHVLELWYEHVVEFEQRNRLGVTIGIIDASRYLDQNNYANDEYIQFMSPALSNAPNAFFPSYDLGIAAEWLIDRWSLTAVLMDVNQESTGDNYTFYGLQAGYLLYSGLGNGHYRILFNGNNDYTDSAGLGKQQNDTLLISVDQQLGKIFGFFSRLGWRLDDEPIDYRAIYSGGLDIRGSSWGRILDNIGIGIVYLEGGEPDINSSRIAEGYYRWVFNPYLAVTADVQYMEDRYNQAAETAGFIYSARASVNF